MSGLDQPIVIANSCYHVGHERSIRAGEEQGFFKEEGLERYVYERGGLIPGRWEFDGLGQIMWERGVDVATAVDARAAIVQRARGADVYIVGGWRTDLPKKLFAAKGTTGPEQLRGTKGVVRETWGLDHIGIVSVLRDFGVAPEDVEWVEMPLAGYGNDPGIVDRFRAGEITLLPVHAGKEADQLESEGYPVVLDMEEYYRGLGAWPPGKVIVATQQTIEHRGSELRAFLRANVRGYWFVQDPRNHSYMYDLETRMRQTTFNTDERRLRMLASPGQPRIREGAMAMGNMIMDGLASRPALTRMIAGLVKFGEIERPLEVDEVLKDAASLDAYQQLLDRGLIDPAAVEKWRRSLV